MRGSFEKNENGDYMFDVVVVSHNGVREGMAIVRKYPMALPKKTKFSAIERANKRMASLCATREKPVSIRLVPRVAV